MATKTACTTRTHAVATITRTNTRLNPDATLIAQATGDNTTSAYASPKKVQA